jgi:hypothetical protein
MDYRRLLIWQTQLYPAYWKMHGLYPTPYFRSYFLPYWVDIDINANVFQPNYTQYLREHAVMFQSFCWELRLISKINAIRSDMILPNKRNVCLLMKRRYSFMYNFKFHLKFISARIYFCKLMCLLRTTYFA